MKYLKPLIYQKIFETINFIYEKSKYNKDIDLFRFKDVLDSYTIGQYESKLWAAKELKKYITDEYDACLIIGGWYGLLSHLLVEQNINQQIINIDLDKICNFLGQKLSIHKRISFETGDGFDIFDNEKRNTGRKVVICTACEHIPKEELYFNLKRKNKNMLVCLQSNNFFKVDSHINCYENVEKFIESLPIENILYSGKINYNNEYDRFMVIGK
tara:strand:+ start:564 stop:1205 length:642 start_codon:yes stop_codon:yes gene_type:complete